MGWLTERIEKPHKCTPGELEDLELDDIGRLWECDDCGDVHKLLCFYGRGFGVSEWKKLSKRETKNALGN